MTDCKQHFFPESGAGGYTRIDGTIEFYGRINALLRRDMCVLDFGAGRGEGLHEDPIPYRRALRTLRGKCERVVGIDIDPTVLHNSGLDEAHVIPPGHRLPLADESIDIIVSDNTFEHVTEPERVARELTRVLKPGGWLCARTPNRWGYIAIGASLIPNRWHVAALRRLQPARQAIDVFPTTYRLNSRKTLRERFPPALFENYSYGYCAEPAYFGSSFAAWRLALLIARVLPSAAAPTWMIFLRKRIETQLADVPMTPIRSMDVFASGPRRRRLLADARTSAKALQGHE